MADDGKIVINVDLDTGDVEGRLRQLTDNINAYKNQIKSTRKMMSEYEKSHNGMKSARYEAYLEEQTAGFKKAVAEYRDIIAQMSDIGLVNKMALSNEQFFQKLGNTRIQVPSLDTLIEKGIIAEDAMSKLATALDILEEKSSTLGVSDTSGTYYESDEVQKSIYDMINEVEINEQIADSVRKRFELEKQLRAEEALSEKSAKGRLTGTLALLGIINPAFTRLSYAVRQFARIGGMSFADMENKVLSFTDSIKRIGNANLIDFAKNIGSKVASAYESQIEAIGRAMPTITRIFNNDNLFRSNIGLNEIQFLLSKVKLEASITAKVLGKKVVDGAKVAGNGIKNFAKSAFKNILSVKTAVTSFAAGLGAVALSIKAVVKLAGLMFKGLKSGITAIAKLYDFDEYFGSVDTMIDAYNKLQEKELGLEALMRSRMGATKENVKSLQELIEAEEKSGVVSKQLQTSAMEQFAAYATQTSSLETLLPVMNDYIAQMYGIDATEAQAQSAAKLFGKAIKGQTETLRRAGYVTEAQAKEIKRAKDETERAALLAKYMGERTADMNQILAQTDAGKQKQLANSMAEVQREFGQAASVLKTTFLPVITQVLAVMSRLATYAAALAQSISRLFGNTSKAAAGAIGQIEDVSGAMEDSSKSANKKLGSFDKLNNLSSNGGGDSGGAGLDPSVLSDTDGLINDITSELDELLQAIQSAYDAGLILGSVIRDALANIPWDDIQAKATAAGTALAEFFNGIIDSGVIAQMGITLGEAFNTVVDFLDAFVSNFNWHGYGEQLAEGINNMITTIDWSQLGHMIGQSLSGILDTVNTLLEDIDWLQIGTAVADFITGIDWSTLLGEVIRSIVNLFGLLIFDVPAMIGQFIVDLARNIANEISEYFTQYIAEAGGNVATGLLNGIIDGFKSIGAWIKQYIFDPFMAHFKNIFGIHSPSTVMASMGRFLIMGLVSGIKSHINTIISVFNLIKSKIVAVFSTIKTTLVNIVKNTWTGIKGVINTIITGINKLCNGVISGLNAMIDAINSLHVEVPEGLADVVGFDTIGFNIPKITKTLNIPKLATGAVLPANKPFLSIVGDQKHGTNIEAPLDTIKQAVAEVMGENSEQLNEMIYLLQAILDKDFIISENNLFKTIRNKARTFQSSTGIEPFNFAR